MNHANIPYNYPEQGFLNDDFRLFHLKDQSYTTYDFHYHNFIKVIILLEGKVNYVIEGRSYSLLPHDVVLVGRGQIHRPEVDSGYIYERMILYLSPGFLEQYQEDNCSLDLCFTTASFRHSNVLRLKEDANSKLLDLLNRLERSQQQSEKFAGTLYSHLLCLEFLIELNRSSIDDKAQYLPTGTLNYHVAGLIAYINEHLTDALSIDYLASLNCISPYHMMRIFKKETGYTIGNYITEKRLLMAKDLLSKGSTATQACYLSGFNHYSTFLRAYKLHFHELPKRKSE